ncbi:MAG: CDP-alcohol phosphatidyltransferase family protein [Anaerolineae bacterium]
MKVVILVDDGENAPPRALVRLCGVPLARRLLHTLRTVGLREVIVVSGRARELVRQTLGDGRDLGMHLIYLENEAGEDFPVRQLEELVDDRFLVIEGNYVLDERIVAELARRDETTIAYDSQAESPQGVQVLVEGQQVVQMGHDLERSSGPYVGLALCQAEVLAAQSFQPLMGPGPLGALARWSQCLAQVVKNHRVAALDVATINPYVAGMRRKLRPLWFRIDTEEDLRHCREALIKGTQKRTLDLLAWHFNRPIENWVLRRIADLPITPNQMTILTNVVAYVVTFLFLSGRLLPGSLLTFAVNVMDGLDGKLARVKGMSSKLGHIEHSFDLLYEQSWYMAFAWALFARTGGLLPLALGFIALLFDSFARHVSMQFKQVTGISLADYAPFDRLFRRFDGRRNIYTIYILLGVILRVPLYALMAMTSHAILTSAVYAYRAARHLRAADQGVIPEQSTL